MDENKNEGFENFPASQVPLYQREASFKPVSKTSSSKPETASLPKDKELEIPEKTAFVPSPLLGPPAPISTSNSLVAPKQSFARGEGFASMKQSEVSQQSVPEIPQSSYEQVSQYYEATPHNDNGLGSSTTSFLNKNSPISSTAFFDSVDGKLGGHVNLVVWILDLILIGIGKIGSFIWRMVNSLFNR